MQKNIIVKDHSISHEEFELVYDSQYDYYLTKPVPNNLSKYYESKAYISHTDATDTLQDKIYQFVKRINLHHKVKLISQYTTNKKILDIGAGTGDFLKYAKIKGWDITGVEPNEHARKLASEKGIQLSSSFEELPAEQYDIITLWHVLEHLPDLDAHIKQLHNLLLPQGTLIIAVPNYNSYDAKHYGHYWAAFDVPRHLYHFSRNSIKRIFSKHSFSLVATKPMLFDSYYVSLLSEKYKHAKGNFFKAFLVGTLSNIQGLFSKEHSSHIYILKKQ
ncbi:class I SAM-dependent methyltransferase [Sediminicola sp. 1XM1-17]|uniref:class I SAM-dependent methyltransferase n=1 Tax=Sediminicola sp. 1XM1-17 TaxID=3127702 RepID=UPI0030777EB1